MLPFGSSSSSSASASAGTDGRTGTGILRPEAQTHTHAAHILRHGDGSAGAVAPPSAQGQGQGQERVGVRHVGPEEAAGAGRSPSAGATATSAAAPASAPFPSPSQSPAAPPSAPAPKDPESLLLSLLSDSGLTIWKSSLGATALGAAVGAAVGVARADPARPPVYLAVRGAGNTAVVAFPFFALRETATIPLLRSLQMQPESNGWIPTTRHSTPRLSRHTYNVVPGVLTGGAIAAAAAVYYKQPTAAPSMALKFGLFCGVAQLLANEARNITGFQGLRFGPGGAPPKELVDVDVDGSRAEAVPGPGPALQERKQELAEEKGDGKPGLLSRLSSAIPWPVRRVSDEEYEIFLTKRVRELEAEVAAIDAEQRAAGEGRT